MSWLSNILCGQKKTADVRVQEILAEKEKTFFTPEDCKTLVESGALYNLRDALVDIHNDNNIKTGGNPGFLIENLNGIEAVGKVAAEGKDVFIRVGAMYEIEMRWLHCKGELKPFNPQSIALFDESREAMLTIKNPRAARLAIDIDTGIFVSKDAPKEPHFREGDRDYDRIGYNDIRLSKLSIAEFNKDLSSFKQPLTLKGYDVDELIKPFEQLMGRSSAHVT